MQSFPNFIPKELKNIRSASKILKGRFFYIRNLLIRRKVFMARKKLKKRKLFISLFFIVSIPLALFVLATTLSKPIETSKETEEVDEQQVFIDSLSGHAQILYEKYHVLPSITIAQAILESDWGNSELAAKANNLFGVKGNYKGHHVTMETDEVEKGKEKPFVRSFENTARFLNRWMTMPNCSSAAHRGIKRSINLCLRLEIIRKLRLHCKQQDMLQTLTTLIKSALLWKNTIWMSTIR